VRLFEVSLEGRCVSVRRRPDLLIGPDADDLRETFHGPVMLDAVDQVIEAGAGNAHGSALWGRHPPLHSSGQGAGQGRLEPSTV
jgi:hypothetical protein